MLTSLKVAFVLVLFYFPFIFLALVPLVCQTSVTLAVIKPDGMAHQTEIIDTLKNEGFKIVKDKTTQFSPEQVSVWYQDKVEESYYPSLVQYLTRGPIRILELERIKAVPKLRSLIGPTNPLLARQSFPKSIRALYGTNIQENTIHASDSEQSAEREIRFLSSLE
ncbi:nucleoside diphosphate kinase [Thamnidium elegans]|nr:nucleoside diphosphate kinase [Thamnidium elegans]